LADKCKLSKGNWHFEKAVATFGKLHFKSANTFGQKCLAVRQQFCVDIIIDNITVDK